MTEKTFIITDILPNVISFYPVISESVADISPVQNAIDTVRNREEKLKNAQNYLENNREINSDIKSLIQGTVDPGVNGGLPKYRVKE